MNLISYFDLQDLHVARWRVAWRGALLVGGSLDGSCIFLAVPSILHFFHFAFLPFQCKNVANPQKMKHSKSHFILSSSTTNNFIFQILTAIFTHLPTSALKTARLVCQLWESIATPFLGEKSVLVPTKMFPCCKSARIPYVNPKLVRNIRLDNHCRTGECKGDGKDIDQRHDFLCKIKNNAGLSVNPSLQKVFDNLSTRYSEHIEQVRLRLIAEYIPRSKDRTRSVIHLACYNFSELPNICLVTIERPSSIRGQAMEIKFDKRLPVPSELKKLYLYPCAIHLQHTGPFNSSEKLMILSEEEEKLSKPKAVKERRRDNIPRRDEVMETVKVTYEVVKIFEETLVPIDVHIIDHFFE